MSEKPHLVLLHSFPTNSVLLHGLNQYLSDFFSVHFIDLPGFHRSSPALKGAITIRRFSQYLERSITNLDLDEYILGGVSFGFLVANNAKLDSRCKAILAMEPFVNVECLNLSFWKRRRYVATAIMLGMVIRLGFEKAIWRSEWFKKYLQRQADYPRERIDTIIQHLDPRTFFSVARILLTYRRKPHFHNLPHFLIGNFADTTIDFAATADIFIKNLRELHVVSEPIDHYPKDLTKSYFKTRIPHEHVTRMLSCIRGEK